MANRSPSSSVDAHHPLLGPLCPLALNQADLFDGRDLLAGAASDVRRLSSSKALLHHFQVVDLAAVGLAEGLQHLDTGVRGFQLRIQEFQPLRVFRGQTLDLADETADDDLCHVSVRQRRL